MQTRKRPAFSNQRDPQPVEQFLEKSTLAGLVKKAKQLHLVDQYLGEILPPILAKACRTMNLQDSRLVLEVQNASYATQLRFEHQLILNALANVPGLPMINKVECRVRPARPEYKAKPTPVKHALSPQARSCIQSAAKTIVDESLRERLLALAE